MAAYDVTEWGRVGEGAPSLSSVLFELSDLTQAVYPSSLQPTSQTGSWLEDIMAHTTPPDSSTGGPTADESSVLWQACVMAELCSPSGEACYQGYEDTSSPGSVSSQPKPECEGPYYPSSQNIQGTTPTVDLPSPTTCKIEPKETEIKPCSPALQTYSPSSVTTSLDSVDSPSVSLDSSGYISCTQDASPSVPSPLCVLREKSQGGVAVDDSPAGGRVDVKTADNTIVEKSDADSTKPILSYMALIANAIFNMPDGRALLSDIYGYVMDKHPYYRTASKAWKNSIRHNLSVNECFFKAGRAESGRGFYWSIHPSCIQPFREGDFQRREARRRVQRASVHPYARNGAVSPAASAATAPVQSSPQQMQPAGNSRVYEGMTVYQVYGGTVGGQHLPTLPGYPSIQGQHLHHQQQPVMAPGFSMMTPSAQYHTQGSPYLPHGNYYYGGQYGYTGAATYQGQQMTQQHELSGRIPGYHH